MLHLLPLPQLSQAMLCRPECTKDHGMARAFVLAVKRYHYIRDKQTTVTVYAQYQVLLHATQACSKLSPRYAPDQGFHQQLIQDPKGQLLHAVLLQSVCSGDWCVHQDLLTYNVWIS